MKHEKYAVLGTITVEFSAEDWVWWCKFLTELVKNPEQDQWGKEDTECILRTFENSVRGISI